MVHTRKLAVVSLVSLMACLSGQAVLGMGVKQVPAPQFQEFKLIPRVNLWGFSGDYTRGEGQAMVPICGDASHALYFLAEGNKVVNDSDWMGGAGFGYRQVFNERIFGGYLIGDYHNSSENNGFYIANPGLEMLGQAWDINVNGYLPFMQKKSFEAVVGAESELLGDTRNVQFTGHQMIDHRIQEFVDRRSGRGFGEEAASGFDAEIGRVIPRIENLRIYLGGYHFDADESDSVNGVEARAVYEFNRYFALEGEYNYDNVNHSKAVLGLRFTLGGYSAEEKKYYGISTRLLDPIEHDLITGASGIAEIGTTNRVIDLGPGVIHGKLWFFKPLTTAPGKSANDIGPGVVQGSGTYEDPYIGFTSANFGNIDPNVGSVDSLPLLYFAPKNYNFNGFQSRTINDRFNLPNGWGMFGRTADYKEAATGEDRASFAGGLDLNYGAGAGGAKTTLDSIRVFNSQGTSTTNNAALFVNNAQNVILKDVQMDNEAAASSLSGAAYGIYAQNSALNLNGSSVSANNEPAAGDAYVYGVYLTGSGQMTFGAGNSVLAAAKGGTENIIGSASDQAFAYGISASGFTVNFGSNNSISAIATQGSAHSQTNNANASATANGIYVTGSNVNISGNGNNIAATVNQGTAISNGPEKSVNANASAYGINAAGASNVTISNNGNTIASTATGGTASSTNEHTATNADANAYGINAEGSSNINLNNGGNAIAATATGGTVTAVDPFSTISAVANAYGINANSSNITIGSGGGSIAATATGGVANSVSLNGLAYGVNLAAASILNFQGSEFTPHLNINVTSGSTAASTSYGIFGDGTSLLKLNGTVIIDNPDINIIVANFVNFTRSGNGTLGNKILYNFPLTLGLPFHFAVIIW